MRRAFVGLVLLFLAAPAIGCSCAREEFAGARPWGRLVSDAKHRFPVALEGQVVGVERPLVCRVAPIRWLVSLGGATARVAYRIRVERVLRGRTTGTIVVQRQEQVTGAGCFARGAAHCEPAFSAERQRWALRRVPGGYERATTCTKRLALFGLA